MEFEEINPNAWKPQEEGDSIEGVYVKKEENKGMNNSNAYFLHHKDGTQSMVWGTTILDDRMSFVPFGSVVRITFKGTTENKLGQTLKLYKVEKEKKPQVELA